MNEFYSLGKYDNASLPDVSLKAPKAVPYNAATLLERNRRDDADLDIKPHYTQTLDKSHFQPNKHLNPQREHQEATK